MGASGGGLFNYKGELLAITTFKTAGNTAFYYSMPVEIIKEMLANGKEIFCHSTARTSFLGCTN